MSSVFRDLRLAARALAKRPASAAAAVAALAMGIGLSSMMFSMLYGVYFRGLNVPEADRLVVILETDPSRTDNWIWVRQHDFYDWREQQGSFEGLAGFYFGTVNLGGTEGPERYNGGFVSANSFDLLRVQPVIGRSFQAGDEEPGAPLTVLLGHDLWIDRYGGDPGVVGRAVRVNGEPATIVGVMPEGFRFPQDQDLWVPMRDRRSELATRNSGTSFRVVGRLNPGVELEQARVEFETIAARLAQAYPETNEGIGVRFTTFVEQDTNAQMRAAFTAMLAAAIFVLLIACSNVANLLLARAALRTKEAAVRTAMGAGRFNAVFPFFSEALVLSAVGAVLGIGIAYVGLDLFNDAIAGTGKPYYMEVKVDLPILVFVLALGLLSSFASGAIPTLRMLRTDVNSVLRDEARGSSSLYLGKLSKALVVAEVALSCTLLVAAGLMIKSIVRLHSHDFNFATDDVFTAQIELPERDYPEVEARAHFYRDLAERLEAIPQVSSVALASALPGRRRTSMRVAVEGETYAELRDHPIVFQVAVTPNYFQTFETGLLRGRDFHSRDDADALGVAIVNQRFAQRFLPGEDPVGRRIREVTLDGAGEWKTIVGVAPNLNMEGFRPGVDSAGYYVPLAQRSHSNICFAVGSRGEDVSALAPAVRQAVQSLDPDLPIYEAFTMREVIDRATWGYSIFSTFFMIFGLAALFLASVGLYGVLAFAVNRRVQEIGIRMALGARAWDVVGLVLRQGAVQLAAGLVLGLGLAFWLSGAMWVFTFQVGTRDPLVFGSCVLLILAIGALASFVPARRATSVDPTVALRCE